MKINVDPLDDYYDFANDWNKIKDEINWGGGNQKKQVAVQHSKYCTDIYHDRCAKVKHLLGNESDYNIINPLFKDTVFEQILNDYNGYGARFASMDPLTLYSAHYDPTPRIHLAIDTDDNNMFIFPNDNELFKVLKDNQLYYVNTSTLHSFVNTSKNKKRIHFFFISDIVNSRYNWSPISNNKWVKNKDY
jgi:hypothetical protein